MDSKISGTTGGIGSWATRRAFLSGDRIALIDGDRRITYAEFDRRTDQLARALRELGVRQGDRVAALLVNSAAFLETMFATAKLGAVFVPINFRLAPPEVTYLLADSGADVFVWSGHLSPLCPRRACRRGRAGARPSGGRRRARRRRGRLRTGARERRAAGARHQRGRKRPVLPHVHVGHHRAPQGRDADPRQPLVECDQHPHRGTGSARTTGQSRSRRCSTSGAWGAHASAAVRRWYERDPAGVRPRERRSPRWRGSASPCSSWCRRCGPR